MNKAMSRRGKRATSSGARATRFRMSWMAGRFRVWTRPPSTASPRVLRPDPQSNSQLARIRAPCRVDVDISELSGIPGKVEHAVLTLVRLRPAALSSSRSASTTPRHHDTTTARFPPWSVRGGGGPSHLLPPSPLLSAVSRREVRSVQAAPVESVRTLVPRRCGSSEFFVVTMYKGADGAFERKEYSLKAQSRVTKGRPGTGVAAAIAKLSTFDDVRLRSRPPRLPRAPRRGHLAGTLPRLPRGWFKRAPPRCPSTSPGSRTTPQTRTP